MRIALYVRVSGHRQVQTQTIEQQLERLQSHSQSQGWQWQDEHVFRDDGYSGASLKRPGLDRLRDQVARATFDLVLITAPDRLARKYVHHMLLLEELERAGCRVEFVDRPMSQDPHDQLLLQIRGAVAEYERTLIADRMRRGRQQKFRAGTLLPWSRPPYGYRLNPDRPRDPTGVRGEEAEAACVAEMFACYVREEQSLAGIVKHVMGLGIPNPSGKSRWSLMNVRGILTNPASTGTVYAGRERAVPKRKRLSPLQPLGHRNSSQKIACEEWIEVGQIPVIVTKEQFEMVQAKLAHNHSFASGNNTAHEYEAREPCSVVGCAASRARDDLPKHAPIPSAVGNWERSNQAVTRRATTAIFQLIN